MALKGVTFDNQNVTAELDRSLYRAHYGDGILDGCGMSVSGDDLVVQSGTLIACGGVVQFDGATRFDLSALASYTYIQVVIQLKVNEPAGEQVDFRLEGANTVQFNELLQTDINLGGSTYEFELAVVRTAADAPIDIYRSIGASPIVANYKDMSSPAFAKGVIAADSSGVGFATIDNADGSAVGGISSFKSGNTATSVYGNGRYVRLQPNGVTNQTSQFSVYTNGMAGMSGTDPSYGEARLSVDASGGGFIKVDRSGNRQGGSSVFDAGGVALYDESGTGIYLRPNGVGSASGQLFVADNGNVHITGQVVGGVSVSTKTGTVTASAGVRTVVCTTGALPAGIYVVAVYGRTTPASATEHYPFFGVALSGSDRRYQTLYSATTGQKYVTFTDVLSVPANGTISVIYNGGVQASVYASVECYRIA